MSNNYHKKIANKFEELNKNLQDKKEESLEAISSIINKAIKNYEDKELWKDSYNKVVDTIYDTLTETYL